MCARRHTDLVDCDPLLVEAERHAKALLAQADLIDLLTDDINRADCLDARIKTPIEESRYGYPHNPPSHTHGEGI